MSVVSPLSLDTPPPTPAEMSKAERLAALDPDTRKRYLQSLTPDQQAALRWSWEFWARPDQVPPDDDWSIWFLKSGRGAGKTRTGSEWVRKRGPQGKVGLLVGATPADVRDLMIEGRSGIMSVSPPGERPEYEPSKRLLTWPNGALAHIRSAADPESIRGPSVDWAWCFPAGTAVETGRGSVPIEGVRLGDAVLTRSGYRRVTHTASRRASSMAVLDHSGGTLRATPEHPIWTERGWVPLSQLVAGDIIATCPRSSTGMVSGGTPTRRTSTSATAGASFTIGRFSSISTDRSPMAGTSTMSTTTAPTTTPRTSWPARWPTIWQSTRTGASARRPRPNAADGYEDRGNVLVSAATPAGSVGSRPLGVLTGLTPMPSSALLSAPGSPSSTSGGAVSVGGLLSRPRRTARSFAVAVVTAIKRSAPAPAWSAEPSLPLAGVETIPPGLARERVLRVSVGRCDERVWDLRVSGAHEFFADGVLAHNCDELGKWQYLDEAWAQVRFALREGIHPQTVITTTPKPLKLIKDLSNGKFPHTLIAPRVATYRNNHLSADAREELRIMYEGTTRGRQELHGEIVEDVEGALWTWALIEAARWTGAWVPNHDARPGVEVPAWVPDLDVPRRVVGVDPSGSESGDECGIVVCGADRGIPPIGYVLADMSKRGTPEQWGTAVVDAYYLWDCELVVAETNFGAQMVERIIRTIPETTWRPSGRDVRFLPVHAGKGQDKASRMVPVLGLYEQNAKGFRRVYHVGTFPDLEDAMTTWVPPGQENTSKWSPDRTDAMVWAMSHLLILNARRRARSGVSTLLRSVG